jgi:hypothetical protein
MESDCVGAGKERSGDFKPRSLRPSSRLIAISASSSTTIATRAMRWLTPDFGPTSSDPASEALVARLADQDDTVREKAQDALNLLKTDMSPNYVATPISTKTAMHRARSLNPKLG